MCDHEEILDSEGYVCIKCGIVLGQQYIYEENSYNTQINRNKDIGIYSTINNILEHLQLNTPSYADEVNDLIDKYLSNLKCKSELKIGACVYYLISSSGLACQLNRISGLVCSNVNDSKKLFKLIQIFPQEHILSNNISKLAELLLSYSNFERADRCKISQLTNTLVCKYCSYSPITQIAGISYWYFKVYMKQKKSLKSICNDFLISQNSVHLYLNHSCVNNWNPL
jgi:hypothetical protein